MSIAIEPSNLQRIVEVFPDWAGVVLTGIGVTASIWTLLQARSKDVSGAYGPAKARGDVRVWRWAFVLSVLLTTASAVLMVIALLTPPGPKSLISNPDSKLTPSEQKIKDLETYGPGGKPRVSVVPQFLKVTFAEHFKQTDGVEAGSVAHHFAATENGSRLAPDPPATTPKEGLPPPVPTPPSPAPTLSRPMTIGVLPFDNLSSQRSQVEQFVAPTGGAITDKPIPVLIDRFSQVAREGTQAALLGIGCPVSVIELQRLDHLLIADAYKAFHSDTSLTTKLASEVGATHLLLGSIMQASVDTKAFKGYGVELNASVVRVKVNVRLVDVATRQVVLQLSREISERYESGPGLRVVPDDTVATAVMKATAGLREDESFRKFFCEQTAGGATATPGQADVSIDPTPKNADVIIDGVFRGNTPLTVKLPMNRTSILVLRKSGFRDLRLELKPEGPMQVRSDLEPNQYPPEATPPAAPVTPPPQSTPK